MASHPTNPYIAGNPVGNTNAFVGREDIQREVLRILRHPQQNAITLYGQRRIGKTSVLQSLLTRLPQEGNLCPVFFDLEDKAALPLGRVLVDLARVVAHELHLPVPDLGSDPEKEFKNEWLPGVLTSLASGACLVLLFDEFDVLADPQGESAAAAFFPYLRDLLALDRARLKFVFVLGRSPNDLSSIAMSIFKGVSSQRITLLSAQNAENLIRLSEKDSSLRWDQEAIQEVWSLTHGHPFFTQSLCSQVWERAYELSDTPAIVSAEDVREAVTTTLEASRNTLEWLWAGLGPAERIVASALAQAGPVAVDEIALERILREGGVRILIRELQNAPQLLQDWDLLEPVNEGYRFRVELLRQWIEFNRPLKRVQQEIDRVQPRAENLYNLALGYYEDDDVKEAENMLQQSLRANPSHIRANELLAELLITQGRLGEAKVLLQTLLDIAPSVARPRLVQVYLAQADKAKTDDELLVLYEQILQLDSAQPRALEGTEKILVSRELHTIKSLEAEEKYEEAIHLVKELADLFPKAKPEGRSWQEILDSFATRRQLQRSYELLQSDLHSGNKTNAIVNALMILRVNPYYKRTTALLHEAVTGEQIEQLKNTAEAYQKLLAQQQKTYTISGSTAPAVQTPPEAASQPPATGQTLGKINPNNPLHQFRVLLWAYFAPGRLQKYSDEHKVEGTPVVIIAAGRALTYLLWLPLILLFAGLSLGTLLPGVSPVSQAVAPYWVILPLIGLVSSFWVATMIDAVEDFLQFLGVLLVSTVALLTGLGLLFGVLHTSPANLLLGSLLVTVLVLMLPAASTGVKYQGKDKREFLDIFFNNSSVRVTVIYYVVLVLFFALGFVTLRLNGGALEFIATPLSLLLILFILIKDETEGWMILYGILLTGVAGGVFYLFTGHLFSGSILFFLSIFFLDWLVLIGTSLLILVLGLLTWLLSREVWLSRVSFILLVIAIALLVGVLFFDGTSLLDAQASQFTYPSTTRLSDGMKIVQIPAGSTAMGSKATDPSGTSSPYQAHLSSYWMDVTEVTNAMYARCVAAGKCQPPSDTKFYSDRKYKDHPVVFVKWTQASSYCTWAGARLPTEAEWEYAAKGPGDFKYPWGNIWDCNLVNGEKDTCDPYAGSAPVGSFPKGASPFGMLDMSGNVFEWVQDWYADYSPATRTDPGGPISGSSKVFRGGSFYEAPNSLTTTERFADTLDKAFENFGFRCASSTP
jgi:formylglycine-generating enzyme required for sulfatase activity/tetratricopeptide (TPR) repeat protein